MFGGFREKYLKCNSGAHQVIGLNVGDYTPVWKKMKDDAFLLTKIPVVTLVNIIRHLPSSQDNVMMSLKGAFPIGMTPNKSTCINVIKGRRQKNGVYIVDKFSLYYPDNTKVKVTNGCWPLLQGYAFRTGVFNAEKLDNTDNRTLLLRLMNDELGGDFKEVKEKYLIIDGPSHHDDCAYMKDEPNETNNGRITRTEEMIKAMSKANEKSKIKYLRSSYDSQQQITELEREWNLMKESITVGGCQLPA
jgi:hypothetical protein